MQPISLFLIFTELICLVRAQIGHGDDISPCEPGHCQCQGICVELENDYTCCARPSSSEEGHDSHICEPGKQCCGRGCCREGWRCGSDESCRPINPTQQSARCTTFVTAIVKPITTITLGHDGSSTVATLSSAVLSTYLTSDTHQRSTSSSSIFVSSSEPPQTPVSPTYQSSSLASVATSWTSQPSPSGHSAVSTIITYHNTSGTFSSSLGNTHMSSKASSDTITGSNIDGATSSSSQTDTRSFSTDHEEDTSTNSLIISHRPTEVSQGTAYSSTLGQNTITNSNGQVTTIISDPASQGHSQTQTHHVPFTSLSSAIQHSTASTIETASIVSSSSMTIPHSGTESLGTDPSTLPSTLSSSATWNSDLSTNPDSTSTSVSATGEDPIRSTLNGSTTAEETSKASSEPQPGTGTSTLTHVPAASTDGWATEASTSHDSQPVSTNSADQATTITSPQDISGTFSTTYVVSQSTLSSSSKGASSMQTSHEYSETSAFSTIIVITNSDAQITTLVSSKKPSDTSIADTATSTSAGTDTLITSNGEQSTTYWSPTATFDTVSSTELDPSSTNRGDETTLQTPISETSQETTKGTDDGLTSSAIDISSNSPPETTKTTMPEVDTSTNGATTTPSNGQATTNDPPKTSEWATTQISVSTDTALETSVSIETTLELSNSDEISPTTDVVSTPSNWQTTAYTVGISTTEPPTPTTESVLGGWMIPVTTQVDEPKPTDTGTVIPCDFWFFSICIRWEDLNIFGWIIVNPPGIYPPGPPPMISIPPGLGITINIRGTLPPWPEYTIGEDHLPTFPPKPTNGPENECETATAELCVTSSSYGVSISGKDTTTTTTHVIATCATVYGCNVEGWSTTGTSTSTATATATPILHVVYPIEGRNESAVSEVGTLLAGFVEDTSEIYTSNTKTLGLNFWRLPLTFDQADELRKYDSVGSVLEACDNEAYPCPDPLLELVQQEYIHPDNDTTHLSQISWPNSEPRIALAELNGRYYFDDSAGQDIDVWIMDTGASAAHPEFDLIRDRIEWITPLKDFDDVERRDDAAEDLDHILSHPAAHGTSMLSLIAGKTLGVAKRINPHIARLPRRIRTGGHFTPEDFIETLAAVNERIPDNENERAQGILLLAHMYQFDKFYRLKGDGTDAPLTIDGATFDESFGFQWRLHSILEQISTKGIFVITGSGNSKINANKINGWPQNFGKPNEPLKLPEMLIVGATSKWDPETDDPALPNARNGYGQTDFPNGLPHVFAPGNSLRVAEGHTMHWDKSVTETGYFRDGSGTSQSSALATGLAAYFLKLAQLGKLYSPTGTPVPATVSGIRKHMIDTSWSRGQVMVGNELKDANAIWNGVTRSDLETWVCPWDPNKEPSLGRRQATGEACEVPLPRTSSLASSLTTEGPDYTTEPLPTLTRDPGTIVTPSGSSCVETATATQCIGSGGEDGACIESPTCISWVPIETSTIEDPGMTTTEEPEVTTTEEPEVTTTEEPEVTITEEPETTTYQEPDSTTDEEPEPTQTWETGPLVMRDTVCENEADYPGHADISASDQRTGAFRFCFHVSQKRLTMGPEDDPIEETAKLSFGIKYWYKLAWVEDCPWELLKQQDIFSPVHDEWTCLSIMKKTYTDCNNGGVGGYIDAGCLRYHFIGGI